MASELLKTKQFTPIPGMSFPWFCLQVGIPHSNYLSIEFQQDPLPKTNPILIGHRWKEYHEALGLKSIVDFSWDMVQAEKEDMLHVLDFPYNGETRFNHIMEKKLTDNKYHLYVVDFDFSSPVYYLRY